MKLSKPLSTYQLAALVQAGRDESHAEAVAGRVAATAAALAKKGWLDRKFNGYAWLYWRTELGQAALEANKGGTK